MEAKDEDKKEKKDQINNVKVLLSQISITSNQRWWVYVSHLPKELLVALLNNPM